MRHGTAQIQSANKMQAEKLKHKNEEPVEKGNQQEPQIWGQKEYPAVWKASPNYLSEAFSWSEHPSRNICLPI